MSKYSIRNDLKKVSYVLTAVFFILFIFAVFSAVIIYPIYLLATSQPARYTGAVLLLIACFIIYLIIRKIVGIYKKYGSFSLLLMHIFHYFIIPLTGLVFVIFIETLAVRALFLFFPLIGAIAGLAILNILLIVLFFLVRKVSHKAKQFLKSKRSD